MRNDCTARCPSDNTVENRPVDWTPQVCASLACPIPSVMPAGYAARRSERKRKKNIKKPMNINENQ